MWQRGVVGSGCIPGGLRIVMAVILMVLLLILSPKQQISIGLLWLSFCWFCCWCYLQSSKYLKHVVVVFLIVLLLILPRSNEYLRIVVVVLLLVLQLMLPPKPRPRHFWFKYFVHDWLTFKSQFEILMLFLILNIHIGVYLPRSVLDLDFLTDCFVVRHFLSIGIGTPTEYWITKFLIFSC